MKKLGLFAAGVLFGTAGIKLLGSKDADITVAFRVTLPEVFSVSSAEYEAMHAT